MVSIKSVSFKMFRYWIDHTIIATLKYLFIKKNFRMYLLKYQHIYYNQFGLLNAFLKIIITLYIHIFTNNTGILIMI